MSKKEEPELEESELEELIEEPEKSSEDTEVNIDESQFTEFVQTEVSAPVLEENIGEQELGGRIFFTPGMDTSLKDDDKEFRYDAQAEDNGEPKYQGDYSSASGDIERIEVHKAGRDLEQPQFRDAGFVQSVDKSDSPMQEKYQETKSGFEIHKAGRENQFESKVQGVEQKKSEYVHK